MSAYPEHEKQKAVLEEARVIGEFLEWMNDETELVICRWFDGEDGAEGGYHHASVPIQSLLAQFFGIDLDKIEQEKRAMLDALQKGRAMLDALQKGEVR